MTSPLPADDTFAARVETLAARLGDRSPAGEHLRRAYAAFRARDDDDTRAILEEAMNVAELGFAPA